MAVKHALLALLADRELTGYELKVRFERSIGDFWQLNSGQVYSTMERLRRAGLVERRTDDDHRERTRYALTPRGRVVVERWLVAPVPRLRPVRDALYVKVVFSTPERLPGLLAALAIEARRYTDALAMLSALVARAPMSFTGRTRWLIAEAVRLNYRAELEWIETVRTTLSDAAAGAAPPPPERGRHGLLSLRAPQDAGRSAAVPR
jgi:DNA-binding PadR family transcriptional regulator